MTTRLVRTAKTSRPPQISLHCPSCRAVRRVKPVGTAVIAKQRREAVQCSERSCELVWIPAKQHVPTALKAV